MHKIVFFALHVCNYCKFIPNELIYGDNYKSFATSTQPFLLEYHPVSIYFVDKCFTTMKLKYIYTCILSFAILSCQTQNEALETALKLADNNRSELEKVLHHYSQNPADSLKLKAAEFLIENMPGHYTLEGSLINEYRAKIDADTTGSYFAKKALDISLSQIDWIRKASRKAEDVEHIKADFLIRHIDLSFEHLYEYTWLEDIPFDIFLEYILPYRFENERPDLWLDSLHISQKTLKELAIKDDSRYNIPKIGTNLTLTESIKDSEFQFILKLFNFNIYSDCHYVALKDNFRSRVSSLPATIDFIPLYANRNGYHYWNAIISCESKEIEIWNAIERKVAKIFRKTYSRHNIPQPDKDEYIPEFFLNPFLEDMSDQYFHATNVSIDLKETNSPHAYLCVFCNLTWNPIAIGNTENSQVEFKSMGKNLVYLPVCYKKKKMQPLNYPFILNLKGEVKYLIPDTCHRQAICIKRKYPFNGILHSYIQKIEKTTIEASNSPGFQNKDTILYQWETSAITYSQGEVKTQKKYRYWRISHPKRTSFAELSFIDSLGERLKGKIDTTYNAAFDDDPLTNIYLDKNDNIIVDFNVPVKISKIICLPVSDGNGIYPKNEYELFYHDSEGWQSLGRQIPDNYYIEYNNVPRGALLWLHNHTTGIEERIFTYEKGEIRFW